MDNRVLPIGSLVSRELANNTPTETSSSPGEHEPKIAVSTAD